MSLSITFMAPGPAPMLWSGTWGSEVGCPLQSSLSTVISSLVMGGLLDLEGGSSCTLEHSISILFKFIRIYELGQTAAKCLHMKLENDQIT